MLSKIIEVDTAKQNIDMKVKILSLNKRTVKNERGETVYYYGIIGDETGTLPFTAWVFPPAIRVGDVVEIRSCYSSIYNGKIRIYVDGRSEVILKPDVDMEVKRTSDLVKIRDISLSMPYVSVVGKITGVHKREYENEGISKNVYQAYIEDETARVRISSFGKVLQENDVVRIDNARVTQFNGYISLSIGDNSKIEAVNTTIPDKPRHIFISEIRSPVGGITIAGFVVNVGQGSRIFTKCSVCKKIVENGKCNDHPKAPVYPDLFGYFSISDGTGTITCYINGDSFLPYAGIPQEQFRRDAYSMNPNAIIKKNLIGKCISVTGDLRMQDDKITLNVQSIRAISAEDNREITNIIEEEFQ
ncbi:replication factor A [Thermoplasma sp. Kam2015]|uniref:replication factor A n=1 Tax=Thermoplasma sp. Kam2015 TaxID=2094122 RepID=UPI000D91F34C|nr:replication factor A [Thermoplasma sp. Kam2015]PYB68674.1 replication factor A [Thermoplasma sp. Kam2015]